MAKRLDVPVNTLIKNTKVRFVNFHPTTCLRTKAAQERLI